MAQLVIFGTGDIGRLAHYYFTRDSEHDVVAFTVDRAYRKEDTFLGLPVVTFESVAAEFPPQSVQMFIALSYAKMNRSRAAKYLAAKELGYSLATYVSSKCTFLTEYPVGENCLILEDTILQPFVSVGNNVTVWSGAHIGHDSRIDDHCFLAPHVAISGNVHVQSYCFIGINATLRNSVTIAAGTLIGAGAVILKDTVADGVYMARPAQLLEKSSRDIEP